MPNSSQRQTMANAIRALAMDAVQAANSGHPGMPMGMADAATALFCDHLKFDAASPDWPDRDRFVLSAGHGSMLIYALLHLTGYEDMTIEQIRNFRQLGARTAGHPEFGHAKGIETTTGPLGQGIANAVGMAMAERHMAARYGDDLVDHHTYVIAGDGCLMEGVSHEAASMAGHMKLGRLIVLFDDNNISIDGNYNIELVQKYVIDGVKKKYYNIKDAEGNTLYEDIALFESAMGIVKHLMFEKSHKVEEIARLDERYAGYLTEAAMYKQRSMTSKDVNRVDVAVAKQGSAISKMGSIKKQIKTLL